MKHYDEYIIQLIQLYLVGDLCGEEKVKLEEWVSQDPSHEKLFKEICDEKSVAHDFGIYENVNKDAAWEFVKYWTGEECNKARIGMELPVLNSVVESEGIMDEPEYAPFYEMLEQSDGHTPASFLIEDWSEISENLSLSFEQIFNPSSYMDVKDVLKEAADAQ